MVHGFNPWFMKILQNKKQLSPCTTTTEPTLQRSQAATTGVHTPQEKSPQWEVRTLQLESSPHSPQLGKSLSTPMKAQHSKT